MHAQVSMIFFFLKYIVVVWENGKYTQFLQNNHIKYISTFSRKI